MHRHRHAQVGIHRFQFFAGQAEREVIHALPAIADGEAQPQNAQFAHPFDGTGHGFGFAVVFLDAGRHFAAGEIAHHFLESFRVLARARSPYRLLS